MINIICANKQKRRHFHAKTTSPNVYINIGVGSRDLIIDEAHTALGIFLVFFPACCLLRFAAFFIVGLPLFGPKVAFEDAHQVQKSLIWISWHNDMEEVKFKMHPKGTVPPFRMLSRGTVPQFKMHPRGTLDFYDIILSLNLDCIATSTTKVVLEAQWGICPAPCVLRQYTVVFA